MMVLQEIKVAPYMIHYFFQKKFNVVLTKDLMDFFMIRTKEEEIENQKYSYIQQQEEEHIASGKFNKKSFEKGTTNIDIQSQKNKEILRK